MVEKQLMDIMTEAGGATEPQTNWADLIKEMGVGMVDERPQDSLTRTPLTERNSIMDNLKAEKYAEWEARTQGPPGYLEEVSRNKWLGGDYKESDWDPMREHSKYEQEMELKFGRYWRLSPDKRAEMEERDRLMKLEMMRPKRRPDYGTESFMPNPSIENAGY